MCILHHSYSLAFLDSTFGIVTGDWKYYANGFLIDAINSLCDVDVAYNLMMRYSFLFTFLLGNNMAQRYIGRGKEFMPITKNLTQRAAVGPFMEAQLAG